ncbi:MAG: hypothetical protein RLZZ383_651 [Pseudomonadota bacterium]|jgi:DNA repair protein RecN (Recombination protein N)
MLRWLTVRDFAVLAHVDLEFSDGLTVVTGETGAGKSMIVEALQLIAGARGRGEWVRSGAAEAILEAGFDVRGHAATRAFLLQWTGRDEDELLVRRTLRPEGRGRVWINGIAATTTQLAEQVAPLLDICSQHEHHALTEPSAQLRLLDAWGGLDLTGCRSAWEAAREARDALTSLEARAAGRADREAVLHLQLEELDRVRVVPGEWASLEAEQHRLAHAERLHSAADWAAELLYRRDDALADQMARLAQRLQALRGVDPDLDPLTERIQALQADLEDVGGDFDRYARHLQAEPDRLAEVEERLAQVARLMRRYGGDIDALVARHAAMRAELDGLSSLDDDLDAAKDGLRRSGVRLREEADRLSQARHGAAERLGERITAELSSLGMGAARIEVAIADLDLRASGIDVDGVRLAAHGRDRVELLIAPNRGEPPRPLGRIASGGELSRALLAVKSVRAIEAGLATQLFDEVDVGVGGAIAEAIGRKLSSLARGRQVLCVTHQPQVAAFGDAHIHIHKAEVGDRVSSVAERLDVEGRQQELARMLGGRIVTDTARAAAAELLRAARTPDP